MTTLFCVWLQPFVEERAEKGKRGAVRVMGQRRVQVEERCAVSGVLAAAVLFFMVFHTRSQMVSKSFSTLSARALAAT